MTYIVHFDDVSENSSIVTGGKFFALARMANKGFAVPKGICISVRAYNGYVDVTGLRERILMELNRKDFDQMRWEEMWDAALRIRNMFLHTPIPENLARAIKDTIEDQFREQSVSVRSSAPGEDTSNTSFAGLHESYVNIRGIDAVLACVVKVWASLWSDAALLYRKELGLDPAKASMAVVVQAMVSGDRSGVAFGSNPNDETQAVVESVHGLNQGLVDGTIEPDRWLLDRKTGHIISHFSAQRKFWVVPSEKGVSRETLPKEKTSAPPLLPEEVKKVYETVMTAEQLFGAPQDEEWTFFQDRLYVLQSRPITTLQRNQPLDDRKWYLTLRRSFDNLKSLRSEIENRLIPQMVEEAEILFNVPVGELQNPELEKEIQRRASIYDHWAKTYWDQFIPFAHGARLFGQVYNDAVKPDDPHEFMALLADTEMESLKRNQALVDLAAVVRAEAVIKEHLESRHWDQLPAGFANALDGFIHDYGDMMCQGARLSTCRDRLAPVLLELSQRPVQAPKRCQRDLHEMAETFLRRFEGEKREEASELLALARSSYRLRDDDNIHLGRLEGQLDRVLDEARKRLARMSKGDGERKRLEAALRQAENNSGEKKTASGRPRIKSDEVDFTIRPRQLIGQPAGPGVASGPARVINSSKDLANFKAGEVLVCDAVDPNMTYVVPLCSAIVERRGGMLIHGAIIAREYGLPCVTGVPDITRWIRTGDGITVDGHLGIVIIDGF